MKSGKEFNKELLKKFDDSLITNEHFERQTRAKSKNHSFMINHFAGKVEYQIDNFLEKNKDSLSPLIESVLANSVNSILATNFKDVIADGDESKKCKQIRGHSLAFQFKDQLNDLMNILNASSPKYVRCIKPNHLMQPKLLESHDVCRQLRWAGVLEAIRIRKIGYPIRKSISEFIARYKLIITYATNKSQQFKAAVPSKQCSMILVSVGFNDDNKKWQIGQTKIFMKEDVRQILEREFGNALVKHAIVIQKRIK